MSHLKTNLILNRQELQNYLSASETRLVIRNFKFRDSNWVSRSALLQIDL